MKSQWYDCPRCLKAASFIAQGYGGRYGSKCMYCGYYTPWLFPITELKIARWFFRLFSKVLKLAPTTKEE